jgi:hypothetical protein
MKLLIQYAVIPIAALMLTGCSERWEGFVYPNKNALTTHLYIGNYTSLEDCRRSAQWNLAAMGKSSLGDYECGLNCEPIKGAIDLNKIRVCGKTEK